MKRYAVILGTEEYEDYANTPFCHNDVDSMVKVLSQDCDYAEQDILSKKLTKEHAVSPKDLLDEIESLVSRSEEGDTILFFYAGHGDFYNGESYVILPNTKNDNKEKSALPIRDITRILSKNKRLNVRVFDTCHSGFDSMRTSANTLKPMEFTRNILSQAPEGSITFASCKDTEYSYCSPELQNGVFTHAFTNAITEIIEGEPIQPERIKIAVCDKVQSWCNENGHIQTPTYYSFVSGNVSIATRRPKSETSIAIQDKQVTESIVHGVGSRLASIKTLPKIGGNDHYELLSSGIDFIHQKHIELSSRDYFLGAEISYSQPTTADMIPAILKKRVVNIFDKERPLHDIQHKKVYQDENLGFGGQLSRLMLGGNGKVLVSEDFIVEQKSQMPVSLIVGKIDTDGYIPQSGIIAYLVPLQLTVALITGYYIDSSFVEEPSKRTYSNLQKTVFRVEELKSERVAAVVLNSIQEFSKAFEKEMVERLNYLEWELKQSV